MYRLKLNDLYGLLIIAIGTACGCYAFVGLDFAQLNLSYWVIGIITVTCSTHFIVRIPSTKLEITVSDTFVFLALLLYGKEAAIVLAMADALAGSIRITKRPISLAFNPAVMACATMASAQSAHLLFGAARGLTLANFSSKYVGMLWVVATVQYIVSTGISAVRQALSMKQGLIQTWVHNFLWSSVTFFAGAFAAGIIAKLIGSQGFFALLSVVPIVGILYFTYRVYLRNVEVSQSQAELAQKHVAELSHHIAEQERISIVLREREEQFRSAFDHAAGMALVSLEGRWLKVNQSLCQMLGYADEDLLASNFQHFTHPDDLGNDLKQLYQLAEGEITKSQVEKRFLQSAGLIVWALQSVSLVRDVEGKPLHYIFQIQDVTERKQAEEKIHFAAFHDALTGLPNRILLTDRLSLAVERAKRNHGYQFAVLFIDLDRFKIINDSLGHQNGDILLVQVSERLRNCVRKVDTVARLGGDEFAILLDGADGVENAAHTATRIQDVLTTSFELQGQEVFISCSIGIAFSTAGYEHPEDILRDSDTAMYRAKSNGKARHEIFDQAMHTRVMERLQLESDLRHAIERNEIEVHYQPIIFLETGRISGFEALARWLHPHRGIIAPGEFIPLAEETGLIVPLGLTMLRTACSQAVQWHQRFQLEHPYTISINLSVRQFRQPDLVEQVERILLETGIEPKYVRLEITESLLMDNLEKSFESLHALRNLGVLLSLDDFGTGYSSLSYLHRFPFDSLKIDRSFVMRMEDDENSKQIVETIVILAKKLGMSVVAEGVEKSAQKELLKDIGCSYAQGFLFARPLPADSIDILLSAPQPLPPIPPDQANTTKQMTAVSSNWAM